MKLQISMSCLCTTALLPLRFFPRKPINWSQQEKKLGELQPTSSTASTTTDPDWQQNLISLC